MGHLDGFRGVARVTRGDVLIAEVAAGLADQEAQLACTPEVRFQLASVSKQFAAAALLLLADQGTLSPGDAVSRWLAAPQTWAGMTIHHLLTHTAGLPHWPDLRPAIDLCARMEPDEELALFRHAPLRSLPGEHWYYSSLGYVQIAHIVQRAAGQPYAEPAPARGRPHSASRFLTGGHSASVSPIWSRRDR